MEAEIAGPAEVVTTVPTSDVGDFGTARPEIVAKPLGLADTVSNYVSVDKPETVITFPSSGVNQELLERYCHGKHGSASITGVWGRAPAGSRGRAPSQGVRVRSPP